MKPSTKKSTRWTSFIAAPMRGRAIRGLHEEGNPKHRVRVEHNRETLLVHISGEEGQGWTTLAIDRDSREWSVAQDIRQLSAATSAHEGLYRKLGDRSTDGGHRG